MKALPILGGLAVIAVILVIMAIGGYNKVVDLNETTNQTWAQVDNQLKRRNDLVPELVNTVKGAGIQEQSVFLGIADAQKAYFQAQTVSEKQAAGSQMDSALSRLLVLQQQYPELKSIAGFQDLQVALEGTENRLGEARKNYNDSVQTLNTYITQLPGRFWAALAGVDKRTYYEIKPSEREAPAVDFSGLRRDGGKSGEAKPSTAPAVEKSDQ